MRRFPLTIDASIALLPIIGLGLVMLDQIGRYSYYGIPLEFLEIDAYKLITSSLALVFAVTSTAFVTATLLGDEGSPRTWFERVVYYACMGAAITSPLWLSTLKWRASVDGYAVGLALLVGFAVWIVREAAAMRSGRKAASKRMGWWALGAFALTFSTLLLVVTNGSRAEERRSRFSFVAGTNRAIVGRMGDVLIAKEVDSKTHRFKAGRILLISVGDSVTLESRLLSSPVARPRAAATRPPASATPPGVAKSPSRTL